MQSKRQPDGLEQGNRLLSAVPAGALELLRPGLATVELGRREVLYRPDEPIRHVYFPLNSVCSIVAIMENGDTVEIGAVGNEGLVGLPVFWTGGAAPYQAIVQVSGEAVRVSADVLSRAAERSRPLRDLLLRYTQAFVTQVAQSLACCHLHTTLQQMARWLLMTHDRVGEDRFFLTQDRLALMLGVRRATITQVAGQLQRRGAIKYSRGRITVVDRAGLETAACECYRVVAGELRRLDAGEGAGQPA